MFCWKKTYYISFLEPPGGTPYNGLHGVAVRPNKGDVNFRLSEGTISRVGISLVEVYERLGISVIKVCKKAQKAGLNGGTSITLNPFFGSVYGRGGEELGGGVSKEIGGSVLLAVWRHVSRQWLSK